jgi:hypothetical protein
MEQVGGAETPDVIVAAAGALHRQSERSSLTVAKRGVKEAVAKDKRSSDGSHKVLE